MPSPFLPTRIYHNVIQADEGLPKGSKPPTWVVAVRVYGEDGKVITVTAWEIVAARPDAAAEAAMRQEARFWQRTVRFEAGMVFGPYRHNRYNNYHSRAKSQEKRRRGYSPETHRRNR